MNTIESIAIQYPLYNGYVWLVTVRGRKIICMAMASITRDPRDPRIKCCDARVGCNEDRDPVVYPDLASLFHNLPSYISSIEIYRDGKKIARIENIRNSKSLLTLRRTRLSPVCVKLPPHIVDAIDEFVQKGLFTSRSEFIREAIVEKLKQLTKREISIAEVPSNKNSIVKVIDIEHL